MLRIIQVVRGGRRITVSIYDLVVGDVVPLKIGDQVEKATEHEPHFRVMCLLSISKDTL